MRRQFDRAAYVHLPATFSEIILKFNRLVAFWTDSSIHRVNQFMVQILLKNWKNFVGSDSPERIESQHQRTYELALRPERNVPIRHARSLWYWYGVSICKPRFARANTKKSHPHSTKKTSCYKGGILIRGATLFTRLSFAWQNFGGLLSPALKTTPVDSVTGVPGFSQRPFDYTQGKQESSFPHHFWSLDISITKNGEEDLGPTPRSRKGPKSRILLLFKCL